MSTFRGPGPRDAVLIERIGAIHRDNYGVYGVRTMWHALDRDGESASGRGVRASAMVLLAFLDPLTVPPPPLHSFLLFAQYVFF